MAWVATENFDGYANSTNLNTLNGGTGWSGAWTDLGSGSTIGTVTAPAGGQGGLCAAAANATANTQYTRAFSNITSGICSVRMRITITNPNDFCGIVLRESTNPLMYVRFGPTGNIEYYDNSTYVSYGAYSANTWYTVDVEFNDATNNNQFRVRVDGGAWSSWVTVNGGSYTNVNSLMLDDSATNAHTMYWDDIKDGASVGGSVALSGSSLTGGVGTKSPLFSIEL